MPHSKSHKKKKGSKVTVKTHRKRKTKAKDDDWQKLFRERFFT